MILATEIIYLFYLSLLYNLFLLYNVEHLNIGLESKILFYSISIFLGAERAEGEGNNRELLNFASLGKYAHGNMYNRVLVFSCVGFSFFPITF